MTDSHSKIIEKGPCPISIDIWSIGCLLAEMTSGRVLFRGKDTMDQLWLTMCMTGTLPESQMDLIMKSRTLSSVVLSLPERTHMLEKR